MHILLDLHEVLADWEGAMIKHFPGMTIDEMNAVPAKERDAIVAKAYADNPNFFAELEVTPWAPQLLNMLKGLQDDFGVMISILTAVGTVHPDKDAVKKQNVHWIQNVLPAGKGIRDIPDFFEIYQVDRSSDKAKMFAHKEHILIDNFDRSLDEFIAAGGIGIKYYGDKTDHQVAWKYYVNAGLELRRLVSKQK